MMSPSPSVKAVSVATSRFSTYSRACRPDEITKWSLVRSPPVRRMIPRLIRSRTSASIGLPSVPCPPALRRPPTVTDRVDRRRRTRPPSRPARFPVRTSSSRSEGPRPAPPRAARGPGRREPVAKRIHIPPPERVEKEGTDPLGLRPAPHRHLHHRRVIPEAEADRKSLPCPLPIHPLPSERAQAIDRPGQRLRIPRRRECVRPAGRLEQRGRLALRCRDPLAPLGRPRRRRQKRQGAPAEGHAPPPRHERLGRRGPPRPPRI